MFGLKTYNLILFFYNGFTLCSKNHEKNYW